MKNILIVDDSETVRNLLEGLVLSMGYNPICAANGVVAFDIVKNEPAIDMLLCDINMPELDGMSLCELLFSEGLLLKIPKFVLTTESSFEMKSRGKKCGVTAWVTKPIIPEKLAKAIHLVLSKVD